MIRAFLFQFLCIFLTLVTASCVFDGTKAPMAGNCTGPLDRVRAKRENFHIINQGCPIDKVPYLSSDGSVQCGSCVPGTTGNERFFGTYSPVQKRDGRIVKVEYCSQSPEHGGDCSTATFSAVSLTRIFCGLNEFCTSQGECASLSYSPSYLTPCTSNLECGIGLQCIGRKCVICGTPDPPEEERGYNETSPASSSILPTPLPSLLLHRLGFPRRFSSATPPSVLATASPYNLPVLRMGSFRLNGVNSYTRMEAVCINGAYHHATPLSHFFQGDGIGAVLILFVGVCYLISSVFSSLRWCCGICMRDHYSIERRIWRDKRIKQKLEKALSRTVGSREIEMISLEASGTLPTYHERR